MVHSILSFSRLQCTYPAGCCTERKRRPLRSTARDVGYTLPAAFLQKYRRFEATFKDVNTMVQGPHVNQFNIPDARALGYMPPRMAEAVQGLYNNPAARDPRVVAARPPPPPRRTAHM